VSVSSGFGWRLNRYSQLKEFRKGKPAKSAFTFIILAGFHNLNQEKESEGSLKLPKIKGLVAEKPFYQTVYRSTNTCYGVTVFKVT